jgi:hypothetical protein
MGADANGWGCGRTIAMKAATMAAAETAVIHAMRRPSRVGGAAPDSPALPGASGVCEAAEAPSAL